MSVMDFGGGEYKIAVSGTASSPLFIQIPNTGSRQRQVIMFADGCGMVVKFGDSTVVADATPDATTKKLPSGNGHITSGSVEAYGIPYGADYVSVISDDETSTGTLWIKTGQGEDE